MLQLYRGQCSLQEYQNACIPHFLNHEGIVQKWQQKKSDMFKYASNSRLKIESQLKATCPSTPQS